MGHVFAVRGRLESIHCDAVIIPTDSSCRVEAIWDEARNGTNDPTHIDGYTRAATAEGRGGIWFVDVTDRNEPSLDAMRRHLGGALAEISAVLAQPEPARVSHRERPLVALPMLGVGGGGLRENTGDVILALLDTLDEAAEAIDIAVVAFRESDFAALQWARRREHACHRLPHGECAKELAELARKKALSLLIGAGVSMGAGLPSWTGLLRACLPDAEKELVDGDEFKNLGALDQAEYIGRTLGDMTRLKSTIADLARTAEKPALGHLLLASLECHAVATTNYDRLYEKAAESQVGGVRPKVIPYERPSSGEPWLLKLHGDREHVADIVIARSDFVGYDARSGPSGALFQSMLMTTHLLAVGVSFADDNVLRLTHEVTAYLRQGTQAKRGDQESGRRLGTVLSLGGSELRAKIWDPELDWIAIREPSGKQVNGESSESAILSQARELEIFLDHVAMHACSSSSYLLDERYASLVEDDAEAVEKSRTAAQAVPAKQQTKDRWKPLRDTFAAHGFREH